MIDIAQDRAKQLLLALTSWIEKREMASIVLDLGHGIVVLLLRDHELPSIRQRVLLSLYHFLLTPTGSMFFLYIAIFFNYKSCK